MTVLVGIDVGTSGVKALALSETGEIVGRAEREYPLSIPRPGWAEQDPEDWWRATEAALADLDVEPASIGLSGQMHGLVTLDEREQVLRPAILWNDQRTAAECAEIEERVGLEQLIQLTGNRALTGFTAPKLLWLRNHEPDTYARIKHILLPKDYVRLRLTGERAIDVADASGTLLFDVANRRWSDEVLEALELPAEWLPPAHECTAIGAAPATRLRERWASASTGRARSPWFSARPVSSSPRCPNTGRSPKRGCTSSATRVPGTWHAMGVMLSAAGSLQWLHDALGNPPPRSCSPRRSAGSPGTEGLFFQPYLQGERTPHADPDARGAFVGLTLRHDGRPHARGAGGRRVRAARLARAPGRARRRSGGRSRFRRRRPQRALGEDRRVGARRAARAHEADEGAAYGAALLGGVARGCLRRRARGGRACVRVSDRIEPDPGWQAVYEEGYARYRVLYPALRSLQS